MPAKPINTFCGRTRREFLWQAGAGFTGVALAGLLDSAGFFSRNAAASTGVAQPAANPLAPRPAHFARKAKSVIFLFMYGGPSHVDTFDYKPKLYNLDGKSIEVKTFGRGGHKNQGRVVGPKWNFKPYGQCGKMVSDLFPHVGSCVDDIAFLHSLTADSPIHGSAMLMMNSGRILSGHPCLGSWVNYGLGSVNDNLPGFVVMLDPTGGPISGAKNWSSGFMSAAYQGTLFRPVGDPILDLRGPTHLNRAAQRRQLDLLSQLNQEHLDARPGGHELAARINSYELAFRMQAEAPDAVDLSQETQQTLDLYGIGRQPTDEFGRNCLVARRLVERGVRFVQLYSGGGHLEETWDAHKSIETNHGQHAAEVDQPIAALLADLSQRGLLDSTLVVWGGEFGRMPFSEGQGEPGRNHNPYGFSMWLAGGDVKGGMKYGSTDEFGFEAVENKAHLHDIHATILHLVGLDHELLTYFHQGRDESLTDVGGRVIKEIVA